MDSPDVTPAIRWTSPADEPPITATAIEHAWLACLEGDPGPRALADLALALVDQRDAWRELTLRSLRRKAATS